MNQQMIMKYLEIESGKLLLPLGLKRQEDGMCYWNITRLKARERGRRTGAVTLEMEEQNRCQTMTQHIQ